MDLEQCRLQLEQRMLNSGRGKCLVSKKLSVVKGSNTASAGIFSLYITISECLLGQVAWGVTIVLIFV